jgi:CheY-like chemotaxis protein
VLLIEDNDADVHLTVMALRDATIPNRIHIAKDGDEALAFLNRTGAHSDAPRPDLVLLDLNLPSVDGFEVLALMKADPQLKMIPVIVVSGSDRDADLRRAYESQIAGYLIKPLDVDRYFAAIRSIKQLWFHELAMPPKQTDTSA